jgi:hypothetical protein
MARVREYQFVTGIETSTVPNPGTPSGANDTISLGYLENLSHWAAPAASYAAMRALTATGRKDNQRRIVDATQETWYFDAASTSVDDGATILTPDDAPASGRWLLQAGGGGGGGGGGGSGIDQVLQKLEQERYSIFTTPIENSGGLSGCVKPVHKYYEANLIKSYVSGDATMDLAFNGIPFNDSDKNYESNTGYTSVGAATNPGTDATAGRFAVGSVCLNFDKDSSAVYAGRRFDIGAQTRSFVDQTRMYFSVYLPSITGLASVGIRVYADSTSNYQEFTTTTKFDGSALAVGLNLCFVNLASAGVAGGTGWNPSLLSRYQEFGITTTSSGQTYTGVGFDAIYASYRYPERLRVVGSEYTVFDNSIRSDIKIATSNTSHDGRLTLSASVASNIAGGLSGTSRGRVMRSTLLIEGDGLITMDNDAGLSGVITTTQDIRTGFLMRESVAGSMPVVIDAIATQIYPITAVGGSTVDVTDPENTIANLLNTDALDVFKPIYIDGDVKYVLHAALNLTANASHSSGTTTLTLTTTGISVGDVVCKRHINTVGLSVVTETSLENFSALSLDSAPDGVQLIDTGIPYPNSQSVFVHYHLGGNSSVAATRNRIPGSTIPSLTVNGVNNTGAAFKRGRFAVVGSASSAVQLQLSAGSAAGLDGSSVLAQHSLWFYYDGINGSSRNIIAHSNGGGGAGFYAYINGSANQLSLIWNNTSVTMHSGTILTGWNHLFIVLNNATTTYTFLNGVRSANHSQTSTPAVTAVLDILSSSVTGFTGVGLMAADWVAWKGGTALTTNQVQSIYNAGTFIEVGGGPVQRYQYTATGQTGQRATVKARLTRSTTAARPIISKIATIVT